MLSEYHGILVEEGLQDPSVLRMVEVLGRKRGGDWSLVRVGVGAAHLPEVLDRVRRSLKTVDGVPFYAHFYRDAELVVVFPDRVFRATPDRVTWGPAVEYGMSVGIPAEELDFRPCRFEDETY